MLVDVTFMLHAEDYQPRVSDLLSKILSMVFKVYQ